MKNMGNKVLLKHQWGKKRKKNVKNILVTQI